MKLSVVILNYNVRYFLELCLESVSEAIKDLDAEIIVVDNNSDDDSCKMVKENFPEVKLIENKENFGFSKGNNIGVDHAIGEYICILNPDVVVAEDTFTTLLNFAAQKKNLGIVGCRLINGRGQFLPESKRNIPTVKVAFQKMIGNSSHYYANNIDEFQIGKVDILVGAFMLLKRSVYKVVSGFDEDYFMYGEDIDLSYKLLKKDYVNYYNPTTSIIHYKGESTLKDKTYAKRFYGAMQIFYRKHFKNNLLFDALVWLGIKMAFVFRKGPQGFKRKIDDYYVLTNQGKKRFEKVLKGNVIICEKLSKESKNSEVIFDSNFISFKSIITHISNPEINSKATFKIISKQSNFMLGSNDAKQRGEVINF